MRYEKHRKYKDFIYFYLHPLGEIKNRKWNRVTPSIYRVYARNWVNKFYGL